MLFGARLSAIGASLDTVLFRIHLMRLWVDRVHNVSLCVSTRVVQ